MEYLQAIFLGIVQGLTEFLPISSSGHLVLIPYFFNWETQSLSFDIGLHFGTALAVLLYFIKDWQKLINAFLLDSKSLLTTKKFYVLRQETRTLIYIGFSIVPVGVIGILYQDAIEQNLRSPLIVASTLIFVSFVMLFAEKTNKPAKSTGFTFKNVFVVCMSQILAFVPGVSRSGITIATGLLLNLSRYDSAKISFMIATPLILGAGLVNFTEILSLPRYEMYIFLIGMFVSFIVGIFCIKWLLNFVKNNSLLPFIIYRILLGALILILYII